MDGEKFFAWIGDFSVLGIDWFRAKAGNVFYKELPYMELYLFFCGCFWKPGNSKTFDLPYSGVRIPAAILVLDWKPVVPGKKQAEIFPGMVCPEFAGREDKRIYIGDTYKCTCEGNPRMRRTKNRGSGTGKLRFRLSIRSTTGLRRQGKIKNNHLPALPDRKDFRSGTATCF